MSDTREIIQGTRSLLAEYREANERNSALYGSRTFAARDKLAKYLIEHAEVLCSEIERLLLKVQTLEGDLEDERNSYTDLMEMMDS